MRHELDAREYKLLLNPDRFKEAPGEIVAGIFWEKNLKPLIGARLAPRDGGEPRHEGRFTERTERVVRFWDTPDCTLTRADLALRERLAIDAEGNSATRPEITLKLRMADLFVVAAVDLPGGSGARTSFEEDIGPLEVDDPQPGTRSIVMPKRQSIRSRFARSTTQVTEWSTSERSLAGLNLLFPTLHEILETSDTPVMTNTASTSGPNIRELVFRGARVKLGAEIIGKFALTLWYFGAEHSTPTVAEISFKCATLAGNMPGKAARRALALFVGMQSELDGWVNSEHSSKTALALPDGCARF